MNPPSDWKANLLHSFMLLVILENVVNSAHQLVGDTTACLPYAKLVLSWCDFPEGGFQDVYLQIGL